ncbi:magnesium transporter [Leuconostoc litchii]|uniref:Magnesium transporter CorA family protein n=1 Tax=Leuconostoc litchii TaxID=1981069 RepID=A0A6P2CJM3_9LACO|nr:magnesium transporter CorA family protein [Leuconostoc litchii]TYC46040.1 magnesium transporter CorA family protein [Leuconostoc litchii]GMA69885.1 magnesium transporter [Leuconostoc litchii]
MIEIVKNVKNFTWYHISNLTADERQSLVYEHHLTNEMIGYAVDHNESVRMEYDHHADETLMVIDVIVHQGDDVETRPIGILFAHNDVYTFTHDPTDYIKKILLDPKNQQIRAREDEISAFDFIMTGIYSLMIKYVDEITEINKKRRIIQEHFGERKYTTKQMNDLLYLKTQMIYIQNSLANNHVMLDSFREDFKKLLKDFELEHIDDVRVEVDQAKRMANLALEVINSVSDAMGNLSNRDLNWTMKVLTVYSIVLTVPTIVSGFYGENVKWLPFAEAQSGWWVTIVITLILMGLVSILMFISGFFRK